MAEEASHTRRTSVDARPQPHRTPSGNISLRPSAVSPPFRHTTSPSPSAHRQSFSESVRGVPPSPRQGRNLSLSQAQMLELISNPPTAGHDGMDERFRGRDWRSISVGELVQEKELEWAELDEGIEDATNKLTTSGAQAVLVRTEVDKSLAITTFDYRDLNQYLLFATGQLFPDEERLPTFQNLAKKAQNGEKISLRDAKSLGSKEVLVTMPHTANLTSAVETFGGGVHQIIVLNADTKKTIGILSQLRLVRFLWDNARSFPVIDDLYPMRVSELGIGGQHLISINGDRPLKEALCLMNNEGVSSLAVVDNQFNVVGNISNVDVKLLTKSSSAPLLENTCIHFISVILSTRGMNDGKDSFPVFHIHRDSTLAHTVAKLVATRSHRMWVIDDPAQSTPPSTPLPHTTSHPSTSTTPSHSSSHAPIAHSPSPIAIAHPPSIQTSHLSVPGNLALPPASPLAASSPAISASALPGMHISGRLTGVVSLTDILNLFARASGLQPSDPEEARRARRGSSASSRSGVSGRGVMIG